MDPLLDHRLQSSHTLDREERIQGRPSRAMFIMIYRPEYRIVQPKHFREPIPFIRLLIRRVQRLVEFRRGDM